MANNTIFDDVFRTMLEKMPQLIIPVINEVFGTDYPADIPIIQRRNEHYTRKDEIITDSHLLIADKLYHIECQSTTDAAMVIRMVEYDFAVALETASKRKWKILECIFPNPVYYIYVEKLDLIIMRWIWLCRTDDALITKYQSFGWKNIHRTRFFRKNCCFYCHSTL